MSTTFLDEDRADLRGLAAHAAEKLAAHVVGEQSHYLRLVRAHGIVLRAIVQAYRQGRADEKQERKPAKPA